jgi:hypothetical protein
VSPAAADGAITDAIDRQLEKRNNGDADEIPAG